MTVVDYYQLLKSEKRLPGNEAFDRIGLQRKMPSALELAKARKAAVAIIFNSSNEGVHIPFIKRANYKGVHSSQMAFPGGGLELTDDSLFACAVRETQEEIGVDLNGINEWIEMSPIYIPPSNFFVQPYVFFTKNLSDFTLQESEVQSIHWLNANILLNEQPFEEQTVQVLQGKMKVKGIPIEQEFIWGASAAMLAELNTILTHTKKEA